MKKKKRFKTRLRELKKCEAGRQRGFKGKAVSRKGDMLNAGALLSCGVLTRCTFF